MLLTVVLFLLPVLAYGQYVINDFDTVPDTSYWSIYDGGAHTYVRPSLETTNVHGGAGALKVEWQNRCYDQYGGWIGFTHYNPDDNAAYDFSPYTHISLWVNVLEKQSKSGKVHFRIILRDGGAGTNWETDEYEIWFSHHYILDSDPGWQQCYVEFKDVGMESAEALWNPGWGQTATGNQVLDLDMIKGWTLEFSQDGSLWQQPDDSVSGVFLMDDFEVQGAAPINVVFFNGVSLPSNVSMFVGWSGSAAVTDEEDYLGGTNSIKWITDQGWDGVNFEVAIPKNMINNWETDSVQFKIKADAGLGDINLVFHDVDEDGATKVDYPFQAAHLVTEASMGLDGTWKHVKVALADFNIYNGCWDNDLGQNVAGTFNIEQLKKFTIGGFGQAFAGRVVYLDDIWTGNPEFDWTPPEAVTGLNAIPAEYYNLVIWQDVAGENGEVYNVYASSDPITDVHAKNVEVVGAGIVENVQTAVHWINYPLVDNDVTFYYAIECVDGSGNIGPFSASPAITNTAKGIPTISLNPPVDFVADGDLGEWDASGIVPFVLTPETHNVALGVIDDSNDLTATVYVAVDNENLYIAADVIDNTFASETSGNWWDWDAMETFWGFYDLRGATHTSYHRDVEPDYKLVFRKQNVYSEIPRNVTFYESGDGNYFFEDFGGADYVIEVKVPFDSLYHPSDTRFVPQRGMRIPMDLYFHDNDGAGWEGNLAYSPNNTDLAWQSPSQWYYTWIGDTTHISTSVRPVSDVSYAKAYELSQNYPNPFNPTTTIGYTLAKDSQVKIEVFNTMGQRVKTLVDTREQAGYHTIEVDARDLTSGIYFYKIQAGDFSQTRKMILMK